jgi:flagellar hook-associated protein 1
MDYGYGTNVFSSLGTAYSGLQVSQTAIGVVSHNIANADNENYTRQRAVIQARTPAQMVNGDMGRGAEVATIQRIHDEYLYQRYNQAAHNKEFSDFERSTLEEVAQYFPDVQNNGIANDVQSYFNSWQGYASSPADTKQAIALSQKADVLATNIKDTADRLGRVQTGLNTQIEPIVNEINRLGSEIADINAKITEHESAGNVYANDLRDERDSREKALQKLVNIEVSKSTPESNIMVDTHVYDKTQKYVIEIGGRPLVDGKGFHPLVVKNDPDSGAKQLNSIYFEYEDYRQENITSKLQGGKLGAMLELRGTHIDPKTGTPTDGKIQNYIDKLDTFSRSLIESTNNIYAQSATDGMLSNQFVSNGTETLSYLPLNIKSGSFDAVVYDIDGKEVSRRKVTINTDVDTMNSIATKLQAVHDDNGDGNANNDFTNYFGAMFSPGSTGQFQLLGASASSGKGYKIAIVDSQTDPTNFAGALGLSRFFDGKDSHDIALTQTIADDSSKLRAYDAPIKGNNSVANSMIQLQYDQVDFKLRDKSVVQNTIAGFYSDLTTTISSDTNTAIQVNDSHTAIYNSVKAEYDAVSKVSTDEELINLVKYQAAYGANAKIVTTLDQMINTLLGIKQ